jgi:hypothetical protein
MAPGKEKRDKVEFGPNASARFERAVDVVAKSPPQPKKKQTAKRKTTAPKSRRLPVKSGS